MKIIPGRLDRYIIGKFIGTYFFAHDDKKYYHGVWHIFVLLGAMAHWTAVLLIIL